MEGQTLRRKLPTLGEVAETAAFLVSDRASAMTGTVANLSGGSIVDEGCKSGRVISSRGCSNSRWGVEGIESLAVVEVPAHLLKVRPKLWHPGLQNGHGPGELQE